MRPDHVRALLAQALAELMEARRHLDYSHQQVAGLPDTLAGASEAQLESVEAFTSRFVRAVDLLVNKVLRSLDRAELKPPGTLLDTVNRAEQRGFIARPADLREMKDMRNMIAHDYAGARAAEIFVYCREQKPLFDAIYDRSLTTHGEFWCPVETPASGCPDSFGTARTLVCLGNHTRPGVFISAPRRKTTDPVVQQSRSPVVP